MEMTQYQKDLIRMWDSLRKDYKGINDCISIRCEDCPLKGKACICNNNLGRSLFNAEKAIEIVTQWAKEHPIVTMADKYKEVFGVEPKDKFGTFICPCSVGFIDVTCSQHNCETCTNEFWNSEYKEPKKEVT